MPVTANPASESDLSACGVRGICMLVSDIDSPTGGVQAQSLRLVRELHARGVAVSVCARNYNRLARDEERDGVSFHRSPVARRSFRIANSAAYLADSVAWLVRNRPSYEVIHCQQMFGPATAALLAKSLTKKPVIVRVSSTGDLGEVADLRRMAFSSLRQKQLRGVDHWVALTNLMKREIGSLGIPPERISIIPNAATIPVESATSADTRARFRQRLNLPYEQIVTYSGRLSSEKNLDVLLRIWPEVRARAPKAHLLLVGSGGAYRNVEEQLRFVQQETGLDSVHFTGHVNNVTEYLLASDVFVLPSSTEGMSNSLLEAMAAGLAIVTTDIEANREVVTADKQALLVPPRDPQALSGALVQCLLSPELAARLATGARQQAQERHSVEKMTDAYLNVYAQARSCAE